MHSAAEAARPGPRCLRRATSNERDLANNASPPEQSRRGKAALFARGLALALLLLALALAATSSPQALGRRSAPLRLIVPLAALCLLGFGKSAPERIVGLVAIVSTALASERLLARPPQVPLAEAVWNVERRWQAIVGEAKRLLEAPIEKSRAPRDMFLDLEKLTASSWLKQSVGITLMSGERDPVAWSGVALDPRPTFAEDEGRGPFYALRSTLPAQVLTITAHQPELSPDAIRTVDVMLEPSPAGALSGSSVPRLLGPDLTGGRSVAVSWCEGPEMARSYEELLRQEGEPFRTVAGGAAFRHFALRDPRGTIQGFVTLAEATPGAPSDVRRAAHRCLAAMGVALFAWLAISAKAAPSTLERPLLSIAAGLLAGLCLRAFPAMLPSATDLYALVGLDPSRDPHLRQLVPLAAWGSGLAGLVVVAGSATTALLPRAIAAAACAAASFSRGPLDPAFLHLFAIVPLALGPPARRLRAFAARRARLATALFVLSLPAIGAALGYAAAAAASSRVLADWLRHDLRRELDGMPRERQALLARALARLGRSAEPAAVAATRESGAERAYVLWLMSGLPRSGVDSALGLFSESEDLVGSFAQGFPLATVAKWDVGLGASQDAPPAALERFEHMQLRQGIVGQVALPEGTGVPGLVRLSLATDLSSLHIERAHRFGRILLARLSDAGRSVWTSSGEALQIDPGAAAPWDGKRTLSLLTEGSRFEGIAFLVRGERVLLARQCPPRLVIASNALGATLWGLALGGALLLSGFLGSLLGLGAAARAWLGVRLWWQGWREKRLLSYRWILLCAFVAATVVPAQAVQLGMQRLVEARWSRAAEADAREALALAQRTTTELFWGDRDRTLSRGDSKAEMVAKLLGSDIDIYERGQLVATSRRQLVSAGVVPRLLAPGARVAELDDRPLHLWSAAGATMAATPVALQSPIRRGMLTMTLPPRLGEAEEEIAEAAAAIRVFGTLLTLASLALAMVLSRGLSRPLGKLTLAAERVRRADFDISPAATTFGEIHTLSEAMRAMAADLQSQQDELRARGQYIETVLDNATSAVLSLDEAGAVRTANRAAYRMLPLAAGDIGAAIAFVDVLARDPTLGPCRDTYERHRKTGRQMTSECDVVREAPLRLRVTFVPFTPRGEVGTIVIVEDVSDVARANRMAAWAEMARTVAHEIKNPLTPIRLQVEHLRRVVEDAGAAAPRELAQAARHAVKVVLEQVDALRRIAADFSLLSAREPARLEPVDLGALIARVARGYEAATESGITLEVDVAPGLPPVRGVEADLERMIRNLLQNSYEALRREPSQELHRIRIEARGNVIVVADDGPGVPQEIRHRIFEPYFSTKEKGSGLGLALVKKIALEHGGDVRLLPSDKGACFQIELPRAV